LKKIQAEKTDARLPTIKHAFSLVPKADKVFIINLHFQSFVGINFICKSRNLLNGMIAFSITILQLIFIHCGFSWLSLLYILHLTWQEEGHWSYRKR